MKAAFVAAIAMMASINVFNAQKTEGLSDIALANVEALANGESSLDPWCNNINGYRIWYVEKDVYSPANSERNQRRGFQDCCYSDREGYLPSGDCKVN